MTVRWKQIKIAVMGLMLSLAPTAIAQQVATDEPQRIANGTFELASTDGTPNGWPATTDTVQWPVEQGNRFLRLQSVRPGEMVSVYQAVPLTAEDKAIDVSYRVRYDDVKLGEKSWYDARMIVNFKDAAGARVGAPATRSHRGSSKGEWRQVTQKLAVPEGARQAEIMPSLFQVASGTFDIDDISVRRMDPAKLPKKYEMTSPVVAPPPANKLPKQLHVDGNQLKDSDGQPVWLQGLSVDSLQWSPTGDRTVQTIRVAVEQWKASCIRLAVKEEIWWGKLDTQTDGGARYREVIDSAINTAAGLGVYIVIDLHRFRAPEQQHLDFWVEFASKYKNHPAVIFELFNEPYGITWDVWRNGGPVSEKVKVKADVATETTEGTRTFTAIGLQQMYDAVRAAGANNIVVIGGLDYSYDLSGILDGHAIDPGSTGNGIVYSTHVYPWKSKWQEKFLDVAAKHPIFMGEVGCPEKWSDFAFIPKAQQREPLGRDAIWPNDMIAVIQKHKLNWTAFSFHPHCGPKAIENWEYEPTYYWGAFVKDALAGKQFESDRLR